MKTCKQNQLIIRTEKKRGRKMEASEVPNRYYVYAHIRDDDGTIFYIGSGTKPLYSYMNPYKRAYTKNGRNRLWNGVVANTSYRVEIIKEFELYEDSLSLEADLIEQYGKMYNNTGTIATYRRGGTAAHPREKSIQTRLKISKSRSGKPFTIESRRLSAVANGYDIYQYDYSGNFVAYYPCMADCLSTNPTFKSATLRLACGGKARQTAYGFQWRRGHEDKNIQPLKRWRRNAA